MLYVIDAATGVFIQQVNTLTNPGAAQTNTRVAVSPDSSQIALANTIGTISMNFWSAASLTPSWNWDSPVLMSPDSHALRFTHDGSRLVSADFGSASLGVYTIDPPLPYVPPTTLASTGVNYISPFILAMTILLAGLWSVWLAFTSRLGKYTRYSHRRTTQRQ
jgi:hypothetical protein